MTITSSMNYSDCSTYYLAHGSMEVYDLSDNLVRSPNDTLRSPVLYITNCSVDYEDLYDYFISDADAMQTKISLIENSVDSFRTSMIAIAFAFSAIVVSSWMLVLVIYLSSHKKPNSIKFASLLFALCVSVILGRTTKVMEADSKLGVQDVYHFENEITNGLLYMILLLVCQLATWIAWLEIVVYIMPAQLQKRASKIGACLIGVNILFRGLNSFYDRSINSQETSNVPIEILYVISQVSIQVSFAILFFLYTIKKSDVAYNIHTLPLAVITIAFMLTPFTFFLLAKYADSLRTWSGLFYSFGQVISCALIWEWILDIEMTSKQIEFEGIVGREIDQSLGVDMEGHGGGPAPKSKRFNLKRLKKSYTKKNDRQEREESYELNNISIYSTDDGYGYNTENTSIYRSDDSDLSVVSEGSLLDHPSASNQSALHNNNNSNSNNNTNMDNDNDTHNEGPSSMHQADAHGNELLLPPDFEPHPNFEAGDYWIDEKAPHEHG